MKSLFSKLLTTLIVLLLPLTLWAQAKVTVTGTVSSDTEGLLIGASVVSGPTSGVSTDIEGRYEITVTEGTTLTYSYLGYQKQEWIVPGA